MTQSTSSSTSTGERALTRAVSSRSVALPAEHGSWSLVTEPILLGLLVAPTWAGLALAVAAFAVFLFNRPFKIYWSDRRRGRVYERTALARRFWLLYGGIALTFAAVAFAVAGWRPFAPFLVAAPLLLIFAYYDRRPGRYWQAELAAPAAFASVTAAVALAGGWAWGPALALWGFMIARAVPAVLFIRARLRLDKEKPAPVAGVLLAHLAALAGVTLLYLGHLLPATAVLAALILLARAGWGLSPYRRRSSAKALGFLETGYGLLTVFLVALGIWLS